METKAAVVFVSGQSNAHAHGQFLAPEDRITVPLKNVFSLDRDPNQSFAITDVVWSGYTTAGHRACIQAPRTGEGEYRSRRSDIILMRLSS